MWIWYMVSYLGNIPLQLNENVCHSNFTICETIHLIWTVSKYLMFLCISENPNCKTVVSKGLQNQLEEITHSHFLGNVNVCEWVLGNSNIHHSMLTSVTLLRLELISQLCLQYVYMHTSTFQDHKIDALQRLHTEYYRMYQAKHTSGSLPLTATLFLKDRQPHSSAVTSIPSIPLILSVTAS